MYTISLDRKPKFLRPSLLYHPAIPPPLHGVNPRTVMGKEWWDKKRAEAYGVNNDCCWACGVHRDEAMFYQYLEAHEIYDIDWNKKRMRLREIVALCHACHAFVHQGRLRVLKEKRRVQTRKYYTILEHGNALLSSTGAVPWYNEEEAIKGMSQFDLVKDWNKWHLVIGRKKFYSKFKNAEEWQRYYSRLDARR